MGSVLLTIGIPTRNRAAYLADLLASIESQIRSSGATTGDVQVLVSDNASQDDTAERARAVASRLPHVTTWTNSTNIGAQGNYHKLVGNAEGRFLWIIGDDDLLLPGGLQHTLEALRGDPELSLLIHFDTRYDPRLARPARFASYRDYIRECAHANPHALVEHTLTSSNVYRVAAFDRAYAQAHDSTDFPHMYGMGFGLKRQGGGIGVSAYPTIRVRDQRAAAVDGVWPTDLERSWIAYLDWLKALHEVPELQPKAAIDHIRREWLRKITRHPLRYVRSNLPALRQPQAWWWFLKRLFFHGRRR